LVNYILQWHLKERNIIIIICNLHFLVLSK
jgi:hypothetical protein